MSSNVVCETIGYFNGLLDFRDSVLLRRHLIDRTVNARQESQREFFRNVFCPVNTRRRNVGLGHAIRIGFNGIRNISGRIRGRRETQKEN